MTTISHDADSFSIFVDELLASVGSARWFQDCANDVIQTHALVPSMRNWPTHPVFSLGRIDLDDPASSGFWKAVAACDRAGADVQIIVTGMQVKAICRDGAHIVEVVGVLERTPDALIHQYRSLTDFADKIR